MEITLDVSEYNQSTGLPDKWIDGHRIEVKIDGGEVIIVANKAGLESLASHILALAQPTVPNDYHLHFSVSYGLDESSVDLILGKTDFA
ncbi:MAG: hypothetical protein PSX80_13170 [bacterium]|nr:hypothetical protein [bacterium]